MPREAVMTRKHYEAIAGTINVHEFKNVRGMDYVKMEIRREFAEDLAKLFASTDHTFNTELFLASALKGDRKRAEKLTKRGLANSQAGGEPPADTTDFMILS
jgi:hypothetical protein